MPAGLGVVRWVFTDPVTAATYEVELNPNDGGSPKYNKNIAFKSTAAPAGRVLAFEGRDAPKEYQVSGVILDQTHLDSLHEWWQKRYPVQVTDDLARTFTIYITAFEATRRRSAVNQWKHDYTLSYFELDW